MLFDMGEALRRQGHHASAAAYFRRAIADDPRHAPSLHRLGNAHKALGRCSEAERSYRRAAALDSNNSELLRQLANALKELDRPEEAESFCLAALALDPHNETLLFTLAVVLSERSQPARARAVLRKAIAVRPDAAPALHRYGATLKDEGAVEEAVAVFRRALLSDPCQSDSFHRIAMDWRQLGWTEAAASAYRRALALDPGNTEALYEFGNLMRSRGHLVVAADLYRFGMVADPTSVKSKSGLAVVEAQRGAVERALPLWFDAIGLPDGPPAQARRDSFQPTPPLRPTPMSCGAAPVTVATSLMPRRIDNQRAALDSWRALGFAVISVNTATEIERLEPLFPGVHFERTEQTAEAICGKPLVFLDACLEALNRSGSEICGLVNSDIVLLEGIAAGSSLATHARGRLLFGSRINVATLRSKTGWGYEGGFDYFLFDRNLLGRFAGSGMAIGAPWWDYWVPFAAALSDTPIVMLRDLRALHCVHPVGYSSRSYLHFGERLIAASADWIERLDAAPGHPMTAFAARALPALAAAHAEGRWNLSAKTSHALARLALDTVTTVAFPLSIAPADTTGLTLLRIGGHLC